MRISNWLIFLFSLQSIFSNAYGQNSSSSLLFNYLTIEEGLPNNKVFNNIQKYGNTTSASIPIAMCEAWEEGLIKNGDLVCVAAFGSGFTWGSIMIQW